MQNNDDLTASGLARSFGLQSLLELSRKSGVSPQTLNNWFHHRRELFEIVCWGVINKPEAQAN